MSLATNQKNNQKNKMTNNKHYIPFWKAGDPYGFLSNWYPSSFTVDGTTFETSEHYLMYQKAILFDDIATGILILSASNPAAVKRLGRQVSNFNQRVWDENKFDIMCKGLYHKFSQNHTLLEKLLNTNNAILVETSPFDRVRGIGLAATDEFHCPDPKDWRGENLLGEALMETRARLRQEMTTKK